MGDIIFKKTINKSEKKYNFIHISSKDRKFLVDLINVTADGKIFKVKINKAGRLVSKKLFGYLNPKIGDMLILEKDSEKQYIITVKQSSMRSKL